MIELLKRKIEIFKLNIEINSILFKIEEEYEMFDELDEVDKLDEQIRIKTISKLSHLFHKLWFLEEKIEKLS